MRARFCGNGGSRLDCTRAEFPRIFVHEVAHFIWLRLGNPVRLSYEDAGARAKWRLRREGGTRLERGVAEGRAATRRISTGATRRWREYCCESFCDTAAWLYSGLERHREFTLARTLEAAAARVVREALGNRTLSI